MYEELIEEVLAEIRHRQERPAALLIGRQPEEDLGWHYVNGGEYAAVVIGSMSAGALLRFPDEVCSEALLHGKPVFVCESGLDYRKYAATANRAFWSRLLSAQRQMKQLGVQFVGASASRLLTAEEVRRRLKNGQRIDGRLTPLAKDVLEGRA